MYGVLIRENGVGGKKNIGDYVQSIAQRQFLSDKETCFVDIEQLSSFDNKEKTNVVMNGWFMHNPKEFPPSDCINPLFISFHLTPPAEKEFFTPQTIEYLKQYEPIGARDYLTVELMKRYGIKSYMSGCLTLTLGKQYGGKIHDGDFIIVDPYIEIGGNMNLSHSRRMINTFYFCLKHFRKTMRLQKRYHSHNMFSYYKLPAAVQRFMEAATFYELYSKRFSDEILLNAVYKTVIVENALSNEKKFDLADSMLRDYSKAKFVITSRLHVSFPCLAMNTRNVFIIPSEKNEEKEVKRYSGRLKGLEDTVITLELKDGMIVNTNDDLPKMMTPENLPDNKDGYIKYRDSLIEKVRNFVLTNK